MTRVVLLRHGLTHLTGPVLAGWTPGLSLDERGAKQAATVAERLAGVPFAKIVTSPLERCAETAAAVAGDREVVTDERIGECHYGDWTGKEIKTLAKDPLWPVVQVHPSAAQFPGGESMRDMQSRAVGAIRDWNSQLGDSATWLAVSHGDVIKAIVADALGMHLDLFQRIQVDPCSLTVIQYTTMRPFLVRLNDVGGSTADLMPPKGRRRRKASSDAVVGGGAGADPEIR